MEFIKVEEFLGQPVEVQKVFLDWWKPSTYDLASNIHGEVQLIGEVMNPNNPNRFKLNNVINNNRFIPLLSEGQLRKFIEDKTCGISSINIKCNNITINIYDNDSPTFIKKYEDLGSDLLQAYWKVATQIAKEDLKND